MKNNSHRRNSKGTALVALFTLLAAFARVTSTHAQPQDYFLINAAASGEFHAPFGDDLERDSKLGFDYISLPPVVAPGQQVSVEVQWSFVNPVNPNAVIYLNAFGDWQPGTELNRLVDGELVGGSKTVNKTFTFEAPTTPGNYRVRFAFVEAYAAVTNFFGGPNLGGYAPGSGSYTEMRFKVASPPVVDYFLTNVAAAGEFQAPFGNDRERWSNFGFGYVSLPPVVAPSQQVSVEVQWSFLAPSNSSAVIYLNAFGDWQPGNELNRLVNGELVGGTKTVSKTFTFQAPATPGTYRIRFPFVEAYAAVTNFYGGPNLGGFAPGTGSYTELSFDVQAPPVADYFLTNVAAAGEFQAPFGNDRERDSDIGFGYVSLPSVVAPTQQVSVELQWSFGAPANPNAVIYLNAFGDWQPGTELARLVNGELVGGSKTVRNTFNFQAPASPGTYRIRIPFVEAFAAVTNFYGGPNFGGFAPGTGSYTELSFRVASPWQINLQMYAGLIVSGPPGSYRIEAKNDINQTNWITLTNITLNAASYFYLDMDSPNYSHRFYRSVPLP